MSVPTIQSYERKVEQDENDKLVYYSEKSNQKNEELEEEKLIINLSIKQILNGMSNTFIEILNELVSGKILNLNQLIVSLFKGGRMIYIGILLVIIAFFIYVVDITS